MEINEQVKMKYDLIIRQLGIQYSLLLGYRTLFVTINVFLLPFALRDAFSSGVHILVPIMLSVIGMGLSILWFLSTDYRRYNIFYLENLLILFEENQASLNYSFKKPMLLSTPINWEKYNIQKELIDWQKLPTKDKKIILKFTGHGKTIVNCHGRTYMRCFRHFFIIVWVCIFGWAMVNDGYKTVKDVSMDIYEVVTNSDIDNKNLITYKLTYNTNVRRGPDCESRIIMTIQARKEVEVIEDNSKWVKIRYSDSENPYVIEAWALRSLVIIEETHNNRVNQTAYCGG